MTRSSRPLVAIAVAAATTFTLACSGLTPVEVPEDKAEYVGTWTGSGATLVIDPAGTGSWEGDAAGVSTSVTGNVMFNETGFAIGVGPMAMDFLVHEPPELDGSTWEMTVSDVELTRPATGDELPEDSVGEDDAPPARGGKAGGRGGKAGRGKRR